MRRAFAQAAACARAVASPVASPPSLTVSLTSPGVSARTAPRVTAALLPASLQVGRSSLDIPAVAPTATIRYLRMSQCLLTDDSMRALCTSAASGALVALELLALDGNSICLPPEQREAVGENAVFAAAAAMALGSALCSLPNLTHLDMSSNPNLGDVACASLCGHLLGPKSDDEPNSLLAVHLGGTGAGNKARRCPVPSQLSHSFCLTSVSPLPAPLLSHSPPLRSVTPPTPPSPANPASQAAVVCSDTIRTPSCRLLSLCLSGSVGDHGAAALASAIGAGCQLAELWVGDRITDDGCEKLANALASPASQLKTLSLGGAVRGGITLSNKLARNSAASLGECLRLSPSLTDLRLSGNDGIGGEGCVMIVGSLKSASRLAKLRLDGCGLEKKHIALIMAALNEVHCLHELALESRRPGVHALGGLARGGQAASLLSLKERLVIARILEDNRLMGKRRVEAWRLGSMLDEFAWVFTTLCISIPEEQIEGGLAAWDGAACAEFVSNLGLPQYAASVKFNLTGAKLPSLQMSSLAQLGVADFNHQKKIISAVRNLLEAYERKARVQTAGSTWKTAIEHISEQVRERTGEEEAPSAEGKRRSRRRKGSSPRKAREHQSPTGSRAADGGSGEAASGESASPSLPQLDWGTAPRGRSGACGSSYAKQLESSFAREARARVTSR